VTVKSAYLLQMARYKCIFSVSGSCTITSNSGSARLRQCLLLPLSSLFYFYVLHLWLGRYMPAEAVIWFDVNDICYQAINYYTF